jgi:hypothetical protein
MQRAGFPVNRSPAFLRFAGYHGNVCRPHKERTILSPINELNLVQAQPFNSTARRDPRHSRPIDSIGDLFPIECCGGQDGYRCSIPVVPEVPRINPNPFRLWCKHPRPIVYGGLSGIRGGVVSKLSSFEELFAGRHFDREVIILCVRR